MCSGCLWGAFTGALVARRLGYYVTGLWGLALVSGLGGGIIRDVCLQSSPPLALTEPACLPAVVVATVVEAPYGDRVDQTLGPMVFADAMALITFGVAGSLRSIDSGLGVWPVCLLGVIRDVLTGERPMIYRRCELYAFAAMGASVAVVVGDALEWSRNVVVIAGFAVGLVLRFGSIRFGWTA